MPQSLLILRNPVCSGEEPLAAACREFEEETGFVPQGPFLPLGEVQQKAGKVVYAWAWEGDADPSRVTRNLISIEVRRGSGRFIEIPEVDRCEWFDLAAARGKINPAQIEFLERLERALA